MNKQEVETILNSKLNSMRGVVTAPLSVDATQLKAMDPRALAEIILEFICTNIKDNLDELFEFIAWIKDLLS